MVLTDMVNGALKVRRETESAGARIRVRRSGRVKDMQWSMELGVYMRWAEELGVLEGF